jgi:hypothetical protein
LKRQERARRRQRPKEIRCAHCGRTAYVRGRGRYCSNSCKLKAWRERRALEAAHETNQAKLWPRESYQGASRPSGAPGIHVEVWTRTGFRMGKVLAVVPGKVKLLLVGPEGEITWVPWRAVRSVYAPEDAPSAPGKLRVFESPRRRDEFLEGLM